MLLIIINNMATTINLELLHDIEKGIDYDTIEIIIDSSYIMKSKIYENIINKLYENSLYKIIFSKRLHKIKI
jgi:hypothetical protein